MLSRLVNGPIDRIERRIVKHAQGWFQGKRVANADAEGLGSDGVSTHRNKSVHDLSGTAFGRIRCVVGSIKRLSSRWNDILVEPEPVWIAVRQN